MKNVLLRLNISVFLQTQIFLLPVLLLFYQHNGLSTGDFFLFQGIFSIVALILEVPAGYIGDLFPKKNVLILSYGCFIARLLLWLFFAGYGYWIILLGEILYAAQKAFFSGVSDGYIFEYLKSRGKDSGMLRRYGKMNFFMSTGTALSSLVGAWCYHEVSKWSLAHYQHDYGFIVLLVMELILNLGALYLVLGIPQLPAAPKLNASLKAIYIKFFNIIGWAFRNPQIRYHIVYSGIIASTTMVFVWSFQPLMELLSIPVAAYGVVYFVNHICRALSAVELEKIMKHLSMAQLGVTAFVMFVISFGLSFLILNIQPLPVYINLAYFCFLSIAIGAQLAFSLSNISRIHHIVSSDMRATVSSLSTAVSRLCAGFFLILLKFLIDGSSTQVSLGICFLIFAVSIFPLRKVYAISSQEKQN